MRAKYLIGLLSALYATGVLARGEMVETNASWSVITVDYGRTKRISLAEAELKVRQKLISEKKIVDDFPKAIWTVKFVIQPKSNGAIIRINYRTGLRFIFAAIDLESGRISSIDRSYRD